MNLVKIYLPILLIIISIDMSFASNKMTYLYGESSFGKDGYRYKALNLALKYSGLKIETDARDLKTVQERRRIITANSDDLNIILMGTSPKFEKELRAIYFPVYFGIGSGYRISFVRKGIEKEIAKIKSLEDLKKYVIGQGYYWSDVEILRNAGLKVEEVSAKYNLWDKVEKGKLDIFPRGIFEIYEEYNHYKEKLPNLVIDKNLLIVYPFAIYFFVNKKHEKIAQALEKGFDIAYKKGEIQRLMLSTMGDEVKKELKNLHKRTRIDLPAYQLTKKSSEAIKKYKLNK